MPSASNWAKDGTHQQQPQSKFGEDILIR